MNPLAAAASKIDRYVLGPMSRQFSAALLWTVGQWKYVLPSILLSATTGYFLYLIFVTHHFFWDFKMYIADVKGMLAGISPYDLDTLSAKFGDDVVPFPFSYPPLVAAAFHKLSWFFLDPLGLGLLLVIHFVSFISIPYMLAGSPKRWYSQDFMYVWGFYLALFGLGGAKIFASGNVAGTLAALTILSTVVAVRTHDYRLFWIALLFCAFVKFYFLAFLLLPLILDKKYGSITIFLVIYAGLYSLNYVYSPQLFSEFAAGVIFISHEPNAIGRSLYTLAYKSFEFVLGPGDSRVTPLAMSVHFVFMAAILLLAYAVANTRERPKEFDLYCCWLFMSAYLISPRLVDYDVPVIVVPLVLLARMLLSQASSGLSIAAVVTILGFILMRTPLSDWAGAFAVIGVWLGTAVYWLTSENRHKHALRPA